MKLDKDKKGISIKLKKLGNNIFSKFFGFEEGIDITDDVAVLNRRNIVIKNIIFVSKYIFILYYYLSYQ